MTKKLKIGGKEYTEEELQEMLEGAKQDAKVDFEEKKNAILSALPDEYKAMFGQIGFEKSNYAVLILSPFDVPPGPVRDSWEEAFEKVSTLAHMALL